MYVCLLAYNSETGPGAIVSKFTGCPRDGFTCKNLGRVSCVQARTLGLATASRLGTGQAIGTHTGAGRQCADATETGVGADRPACILHMSMGCGGLESKSGMGLPT